jgi:hypothetical protein
MAAWNSGAAPDVSYRLCVHASSADAPCDLFVTLFVSVVTCSCISHQLSLGLLPSLGLILGVEDYNVLHKYQYNIFNTSLCVTRLRSRHCTDSIFRHKVRAI